jgi:predicted RNase H-like nuclease (RuvC/YqgF family)
VAATNLALVEASRTSPPSTAGTAADTTNNNTFLNDGHVVLIVKNTGASTYTVTANLATTVDGQAVTGKQISVAASAEVIFGPFPIAYYGTNPIIVSQNVAITLLPLHVTANG